MFFKLSNLNSKLALNLGYLNPALNNSAQILSKYTSFFKISFHYYILVAEESYPFLIRDKSKIYVFRQSTELKYTFVTL